MSRTMRSRWKLKCGDSSIDSVENTSKRSCIGLLGWQEAQVWTILVLRQYRVTYMPTVLRVGPYRFFFYSGDRDEPQHVHIERDNRVVKFWLDPVSLQRGGDFARSDISRIQNLVADNREILLRSWNEFFNR